MWQQRWRQQGAAMVAKEVVATAGRAGTAASAATAMTVPAVTTAAATVTAAMAVTMGNSKGDSDV